MLYSTYFHIFLINCLWLQKLQHKGDINFHGVTVKHSCNVSNLLLDLRQIICEGLNTE